ncbi:MAG TPA: FAD:protein FMN transferase, partial [Longimicrobiales bacterium]|nr:FAD:protein FMN transferase [Longimicrobiales bacterium]
RVAGSPGRRPARESGRGAVLAVVALLLSTGCSSGGAPSAVEVERSALLMGTTLTARVVAGDRPHALAATEAVFDEVARVEALVSSWDSATALGRLNRAPADEPVPVDPELLALLLRADAVAEDVGRSFEPAVGPLVDAWDLRGDGRTPTPGELTDALTAVRAGFSFDRAAGTVTRRHPDAWIDAGAFGKGAALEAAGRILADLGVAAALLDFGGQVLTLGERPGGGPWRIGVAHPARRSEAVTELRVGPGLSVATSGGSERPGHLLDPLTGARLASWGSVTVVSGEAVTADALATGLFVVGPRAALAWAGDRPEVGVLVLDADRDGGLTARWNPAMTAWLDTTAVGQLRPSARGPSADGTPRGS